jgi:hypothetical protein
MKRFLSILLLNIVCILCFGQINCHCGALPDIKTKNEPDTIVKLSNNNSFAICGWFDTIYGEKVISEFTITVCGEINALRFYSAVENYKIAVSADTLILSDMRILPIGENHNFKMYPWAFEYYYFARNKTNAKDSCIIKRKINKNLKKLNQNEISLIDSIWNNSTRTDYLTNEQFISLIFLAAISGNELYQKRLLNFRNTFKIDGEYAEYYNELVKMFYEWK